MPIEMYLAQSLASFVKDPPKTSYQRGYEAAIREVFDRLRDGTIKGSGDNA